ncbi:unnamed protein product [Blepharisma stoltei]|uniref:Uncharacterized protein n=1 Tax=Blepharisma stoltei TaxID=1481888 RepID=A0AAU9IHC8_9CILI|nr:unnamed protein product [Blepharisma stoltei]
MEDRASTVIIFLSLLILAYNWNIKFDFSILNWILYGSLIGLYLFWSLGLFLRRKDTKLDILTNHGAVSQGIFSMFSFQNNKFYCIAGLIIGGYSGYNLSIVYTAYSKMKFSITISFLINSIASIVTTLIITGFENSKTLRNFLPFFYPDTNPWTVSSFLRSLYTCMVIGEYVGLMAMLYLGFFEIMYFVSYEIASYIGWWWILGGVGVCCCMNAIASYQQAMLRRRRKLEKQEEIELNNFTTVV